MTAESIMAALLLQSKIYTVSQKTKLLTKNIKIEDPDDLIFIELAYESGAKFIISGDRHLLELGKAGNTDILSVDGFLDLQQSDAART